jgi:hypothetical protein
MKINWKRILVAATLAELVGIAIYFPGRHQYADPSSNFRHIFALCMIVSMFLAGLWVARKIESGFILHGALIGIAANVIYVVLAPLFVLSTSPSPRFGRILYFIVTTFIKMLPAVAGAYVGGRRRKKLLSAQASKSPS